MQMPGISQLKTQAVPIGDYIQQDYGNRITQHMMDQQKQATKKRDMAALAQTLMKDKRFKDLFKGMGAGDIGGGGMGFGDGMGFDDSFGVGLPTDFGSGGNSIPFGYDL